MWDLRDPKRDRDSEAREDLRWHLGLVTPDPDAQVKEVIRVRAAKGFFQSRSYRITYTRRSLSRLKGRARTSFRRRTTIAVNGP
jgi:hypothetical protein